jgi:hypothetical protein
VVRCSPFYVWKFNEKVSYFHNLYRLKDVLLLSVPNKMLTPFFEDFSATVIRNLSTFLLKNEELVVIRTRFVDFSVWKSSNIWVLGVEFNGKRNVGTWPLITMILTYFHFTDWGQIFTNDILYVQNCKQHIFTQFYQKPLK